jgi:hypothetical protein
VGGKSDPEGIGRFEALLKAPGPAAVREARRREEWRKQDTGPRGPEDPRTLLYGMRLTPSPPPRVRTGPPTGPWPTTSTAAPCC